MGYVVHRPNALVAGCSERRHVLSKRAYAVGKQSYVARAGALWLARWSVPPPPCLFVFVSVAEGLSALRCASVPVRSNGDPVRSNGDPVRQGGLV